MKQKMQLPNGIVLEDDNKFVGYIQDVIDKNKLDLKAFLATDSNGYKEYVLFDSEKPVYANTSLEAIFVHIDMIRLEKHFMEKK